MSCDFAARVRARQIALSRGHIGDGDLLDGGPGKRNQQLGGHLVAQAVEVLGPLGEVTAVDAGGELLPG